MNIATSIAALLLVSFAAVERAEAHGYYVGPKSYTYTFLGCCGDSRTSVRTKVTERYYYWPFDTGDDSDSDDIDRHIREQNWGYHWHSRSYTDCVNRNHGGYNADRCDTEVWDCEDVEETATSHYAKCEVWPTWDTACHANATDPEARFGYDWEDDSERETDEDGFVWLVTYRYYYEISVVEQCGWVLVP